MPHGKIQRWLNGLATLQHQMTDAQGNGEITITPSYLRRSAAAMRRCARALAALGPPARPLRPTYQLARQACAAFAQAARLNVAAARIFTAEPDPKLAALLNQSTAAINQGLDLISRATYEAPILPGN